jgi:hypothetical protein
MKLRSDTVDPMFTQLITEALFTEPKEAYPRTDTPLPIRAKFLTERVEPRCVKFKMETAWPNRPKLLHDIEDPRLR